MIRLASRALAALSAATLALTALPTAARAQKALVYCPVGIDVAGCDRAVTALAPDFPDGVDRAFDGSAGTVDVKSAELWSYSVLVVPSLADGADLAPYALLRDAAVSERLHDALMGRVALWSGTPDQGSTNREAKDALLRSLARWAAGNYGTVKGPGLVVLQDLSEQVGLRYGWLKGLTGLTVTTDSAVLSYSSVRAMTATGSTIITSGGSPIAYSNMASLGFYLPEGAANVTLDAVGQTGTTKGGQVVLVTSPGGNTGTAVIRTDRDDYPPGTPVTITGTGFQPGETVSMVLHEDPEVHDNRTLTSVADASGAFVNTSFAPEDHDIDVRFVLSAVGAASGMRAEATFTDGNVTAVSNAQVGSTSATPGVCGAAASTFTVGTEYCGKATASTVTGGGTTDLFMRWVRPNGTASACAQTYNAVAAGTTYALKCTPDVAGTWVFQVASNSAFTGSNILASVNVSVGAATTAVSFTVTNTTQTYDGTSKTVTVSTTPSGVATTVTYAGTANDGSSYGPSTTGPTKAGNYTWTVAPNGGSFTGSASGSLTIDRGSQAVVTVTGMPAAAQSFGSSFTVGASGGSGTGSYSFAASGACSVSAAGGVAQMSSGTGTCSITATRAGDDNYLASGPSAPATVAAALAAQATLSVTGMPTTAQPFGATFSVGTAGGSGAGAVAFAATGACTVNATTGAVQISSGTGSCSVTASKAADNDYASTSSAAVSVAAAKVNQVIAWATPASITFGTPLSSAQLNATLTTGDGALSYDQAPGVVLGAGTHTLTATAAATDNYNAATKSVSLTVSKADQATLSVTSPTSGMFGDRLVPTFAGGSGDGAVTFSASGTACQMGTGVDAGKLVITAGTGSCSVTASKAASDNYNAATSAAQTVAVSKKGTTISLGTLSFTYTGAPQGTTATTPERGTAGITVTYDGSTTPPTNVKPGGYAVVATFSDGDYQAPNATGTLVIERAGQSITFAELAAKTFGDADFLVSATATSGLDVTFSVGSGDNCTMSGATVRITGAGSCTVTAVQGGNTNFNPATSVARTFSIARATPTVTAVGGTFTFDNSPKSGSGSATGVGSAPIGPVSVSYYAGFPAAGSPLAGPPTNAGPYTVRASYAGSANYNAGSDDAALTIEKANQAIGFDPLAGRTFGDAPFSLSATAPGGTVTFALGSGSVGCSLAGSTVSITGATSDGKCIIVASQGGSGNYNPAPDVTRSFSIARATPTVTVSWTGGTFGASAAATGAVVGVGGADLGTPTFNYTGAGSTSYGPSATAPTDAGSYTVTASFAGNANYEGASSSASTTIAKAPSTTTVTVPAGAVYSGSPQGGSASVAGVGGLSEPVTVTYVGRSGTTYASSTTAPTNAGDYTASASYAGGPNHLASADSKDFSIAKAPSSVALVCPTTAQTYTGLAQTPCTATATGAGSLSVAVTPTYSNNVNAGSATVSAAFAGDANHDGNSATGGFEIARANPTVVAVGGSFVYNGSPRSGSGTATGVRGENLGAVTLNYVGVGTTTYPTSATAPTNAGTYEVTASYAGSANYNARSSAPDPLTIAKATIAAPVLTDLVKAYTGSDLKPTATTTPAGVTVTLSFSQDGVTKGSASGVTPVGVYAVLATVTDANYTGPTASALFVIYDPSGGFVTGGGWINSPSDACRLTTACQGVTGKANFGFVSKYQAGANKSVSLTGSTEFQFQAGNLNFKSTSYEWLTVAGARAQYKGTGTINGSGSYGFMLTAIDGSVPGGNGTDRFRIKITDASGAVVYDNQIDTTDDSGLTSSATLLGGGSISIKK